jgi:hypothetical protein
MSDDIPIIFAENTPQPTALFLSASGASHVEQFTAAGWAVAVTTGFCDLTQSVLDEFSVQTIDESIIINPTLVSWEARTWTDKDLDRIARWKPRVVKVNCAFSDLDPARIEKIAKDLASLRLIMVVGHWRDDNTFRVPSLNRVDRLEVLQPPEWSRLNLIACADEENAKRIVKFGRLYAGQEQRIAQMRVSEAVRNEQIARLEAALIAAQQSPYFKAPS